MEVGSSEQTLVDSDAFVGWIHTDDKHNKSVKATFRRIKKAHISTVTSSWVVAETATVLSHRDGQNLARDFLRKIRDLSFPIIHVDERLLQDATRIFELQEKKGTSMVDCGNVAIAKRFGITRIFSFDKFYAKQFGLSSSA